MASNHEKAVEVVKRVETAYEELKRQLRIARGVSAAEEAEPAPNIGTLENIHALLVRRSAEMEDMQAELDEIRRRREAEAKENELMARIHTLGSYILSKAGRKDD